ncbi:hypothetical protein [Calidifontibacillus oryziterrae]|uniref:hypothetical protein n=1 Tax=Calidifontibacillus oryziterrae TaxID=1191699 RepID=UPI00036B3BCC|nr:hypothetical protein [Calidifontibacillus oryziterrae]
MKKTNKLLFIMIFLLVTSLLSGCGNGTEEPEIKIHYGSEVLNPIYYGDLYNKEQEDIEKRFKDFMVGKRFSDLPIVAYGGKIQVEALNFETEEIEIYDYVLDENANIVSEYNISPLSISSVKEGIAEFTFEESLDLEMYQDFTIEGKLVHGLLIRCEIDNNTFAFSTLVLGE